MVGFHGHSKSTGNEVVRLSYPVLASDGTVAMVMVAGLNLKWLSASNLVTNAAQAIGGDVGQITVKLWSTSRLDEACSLVCLSIADTGCGMDESTINRIFELFYTTKGVGEGTGLGLSVVHGIVTSQGGHIDISSRPGEGTRITISLPAINQPQRQNKSKPRLVEYGSRKPELRAILDRTRSCQSRGTRRRPASRRLL